MFMGFHSMACVSLVEVNRTFFVIMLLLFLYIRIGIGGLFRTRGMTWDTGMPIGLCRNIFCIQ